MTGTLSGHLGILRLNHWIKNVFILPGVLVALAFDSTRTLDELPIRLLVGLLAAGAVSSSNYVLNEILDAPYDRLHPTKRLRAVPSGKANVALAYCQWLLLGLAGVFAGFVSGPPLVAALALFWGMGWLYNIPPVRAKDVPYLDVLAEGFNNPVRLLIGWYLTGTNVLPSTSLLMSYWMAGCYFMSVKRLAELRAAGDHARIAAYRKSFRWYTEPRLLVFIVFCASLAMLFFGAFLMRYRMELALSFPLVAWVMAAYLAMVYDPDSAAQAPEKLYREPGLMLATICCAVGMILFLFVDVPLLEELFPPSTLP